MVSHHENNQIIYTDAAKSTDGVGCAYHSNTTHQMYKLPEDCSIFTAELIAIQKAIEYAVTQSLQNTLICSDSMSSIQAIMNMYSKNPIVNHISDLMNQNQTPTRITLMWIPSHSGIDGNEKADIYAKKAISEGQPTEIMTTYDLSTKYKNEMKQKWATVFYHRRSELSFIPTAKSHPIMTRRNELVTMRRLRIGHTRFTHSYLLKKEPPPQCNSCNVQITVKHILEECPLYENQRKSCAVSSKIEDALNINRPEAFNTILFFKTISIKI